MKNPIISQWHLTDLDSLKRGRQEEKPGRKEGVVERR